jgi:murein DD-endopeptidase MepM/ murein hydrolase activator NlpD
MRVKQIPEMSHAAIDATLTAGGSHPAGMTTTPGTHTHRKMSDREVKKAAASRRHELVFTYPTPGYPVTYAYGVLNPDYAAGHHTGEDHACPVGTFVHCVHNGTVVDADWGADYGNYVVVESFTWRGKRRTGYCHLSGIHVNPGDRVKRGDRIGVSGESGNVTGPHLHLEARRSPFSYGDDVDPLQVLKTRLWGGH